VPYLRDLSEDLSRIESQAGAWAEQLILTFRVYLNKSGHEASLGIRFLTGITALTLPVIMVGGWFGMNYRYMHELSWVHGYGIASALTVAGTVGMFIFMRKKKWL
jgi:magnesium transporter